MKIRFLSLYSLLVCLYISTSGINAQKNNQVDTSFRYTLTMSEAVELAQMNSIASMQYKNMYVADYWNFRSYKASRLPSLMFGADIGNYNRSIVPLQNAVTGEISYQQSNNMSNRLQLSVDQRIFATGGYLSLYTSLERLDQFGASHYADYYSQPLSLSYVQPFFAYNPFKWDKKTEPERYEVAKKEYLENMALVSYFAVSHFWDYAYQFENYNLACGNFTQSKDLYIRSQEKFRLGAINKATLLQLKLKVYNDSLAVNSAQVNLISAKNRLSSFIGLKANVELYTNLNYELPEVELAFTKVMEDALRNSSFTQSQQLEMLEAQEAVDRAKGERGFSMQLNARFGLSNNDPTVAGVYRNLRDQEVVGLGINVPIYDWGVGRGKVQMARAQEETKRNELEQEMVDFQQDLYLKVMQFNNQKTQCEIAQQALSIAKEAYDLAVENFLNATMTVTDLNALRTDYDNAQMSYIQNLGSYWKYYYDIRKLTLYDYHTNTHLQADFENLVEK